MSMPYGQVPPGWYDVGSGHQRWWDGQQWQQYAPEQPRHMAGPMTASQINVRREAVYTRQQTGHSLIVWILASVFLWFPVIWVIYYTISPNHYWHA